MSITFDDQVAIVTGAGGGLGKCHALDLAKRGAKVIVNDLGGNVDGSDDGSLSAAEMVVEEIKAAGGEERRRDLGTGGGGAETKTPICREQACLREDARPQVCQAAGAQAGSAAKGGSR